MVTLHALRPDSLHEDVVSRLLAAQTLADTRWLVRATMGLRRFLPMLHGRLRNWPDRIATSIDEHRVFTAAVEQGDAPRAERLMHDRLLAQLAALKALHAHEQAREQAQGVLAGEVGDA